MPKTPGMGITSVSLARFLALLCAASAVGCASLATDSPGVSHYLGYVRVERKAIGAEPHQGWMLSTSSYGIQAGADFHVGMRSERLVRVPPDCRLFVWVERENAVEAVARMLREFNGASQCVLSKS